MLHRSRDLGTTIIGKGTGVGLGLRLGLGLVLLFLRFSCIFDLTCNSYVRKTTPGTLVVLLFYSRVSRDSFVFDLRNTSTIWVGNMGHNSNASVTEI